MTVFFCKIVCQFPFLSVKCFPEEGIACVFRCLLRIRIQDSAGHGCSMKLAYQSSQGSQTGLSEEKQTLQLVQVNWQLNFKDTGELPGDSDYIAKPCLCIFACICATVNLSACNAIAQFLYQIECIQERKSKLTYNQDTFVNNTVSIKSRLTSTEYIFMSHCQHMFN